MARFVIEDDADDRYVIDEPQASAPQAAGESIAYQSGRQLPSPLQGFISSMQGPTFGFLDELTGAVQGAGAALTGGNPAQAYREGRDLMRGAQAQYRKDYPVLAPVTQAAAATMPFAVGMPSPALVKTAGPVSNIINAAIPAAVYGGVSALGESEADTIGGAAGDVGGGAMTAGIMAGVTQPMAAAIAAGGRGVMRAAGGPKGPAQAVGAGGLAQGYIRDRAREELAKNMARDVPPGTVFDDVRIPSGAVSASGKPIMRQSVSSGAERAAARVGKLGPDAYIADLPGENVRQLIDTVATLPGQTKNLVANAQRARRAGAYGRLAQAADDAIAAGNTEGRALVAGRKAVKAGQVPPTPALRMTIDALEAERKKLAGPLYDQLRATSVTLDDDMATAVNAMRQLGALNEAKQMAIAERRGFSLDRELKAGDVVSAADLDLAKRGMDTLISGQTDAVGKMSAKGVTFQRLLREFRDGLDNATTDPETGLSIAKQARDAYAGRSAMIDAANLGRRSLDADKNDKIYEAISDLGDSEMSAFRVGLLQAVKDKAGTGAGRTQLLSYWENPAIGDKLKQAFGGNFRQFAAALMKEQQKRGLLAVNANSATARRLAGADDLGQAVEDVADAATSLKTGSPVGFFGGIKRLYQKTTMPEPVRDELGRLLMLQGPEAQRELLSLADLLRAMQAKRAGNAARLGGAVGASTGRAGTQNRGENQ